jgi:hypothetical protein
MTTSACSRCGGAAAASGLSLSLDGSGMICQACSIEQKAVQEKAGTRKAYLSGAIIVGGFILYVIWRIIRNMAH